MDIDIEIDRETDGRWIASCSGTVNAAVYGATEAEAVEKLMELLVFP